MEKYNVKEYIELLKQEDILKETIDCEKIMDKQVDLVSYNSKEVQENTLFVVKATEDNIGKVAEKLTSYRDMLLHDSFQYPANMPKIEASVVEVYDDYVVFMMLGDMFKYPTNEDGSVKDVEDSGVLDFYANETKKGLDALAFLFDNGYVEPVVEDTNETDVVNEVEEPEGDESIVMNEDNNASDFEIEKESVEPIGEVENTESSASDFS